MEGWGLGGVKVGGGGELWTLDVPATLRILVLRCPGQEPRGACHSLTASVTSDLG